MAPKSEPYFVKTTEVLILRERWGGSKCVKRQTQKFPVESVFQAKNNGV